MAISGSEAFQRVKGWAGLLLTATSLLAFLPHPAVQAIAGPIREFLLASGLAGAALQANSPKIIGKKDSKKGR